MGNDPATSESQQLPGIIDEGEMSFSVDTTPKPETHKETKPAVEPVVEEEKPAEEGGETPQEPEKSETDTTTDANDNLPKGVRKSLDRMTRKMRDSERETTKYRTENEALLARITTLEDSKANAKPVIEDFEDEEAFFEALGDWKAGQIMAKKEAENKADKVKQTQEAKETTEAKRQEALRKKLKKGVDKYNDFEDVVDNVELTGEIVEILEGLPNIPDVVYKLGKDLEVVEDLNEMSFLNAAFKLKEISDDLMKKKTTKAPAPIKPIKTTGASIKNMENMSMSEYNKVRDQQDKEKRGRY